MLKGLSDTRLGRFFARHWLTLAFVAGFIVDNLTLNRVDQIFDNAILASYVVLSMLALMVLYASSANKFPERINPFLRKYAPLLVQFSFGGLLSGMLIFYGRSGDWIASWPFLLIIILVIYGNETIEDRAGRLVFNIAIFFVGLFSYTVLIIPVMLGQMGALIFIGSGLIALFITYCFLLVLFRIIPNFLGFHLRAVVFTLGAIYATMNAFYFLNIIPPIPLSLKELGIYQSVIRYEDGRYQLKYEAGEWWEVWKRSDTELHVRAGTNIFCFAQVFAPTKINTDIFHSWEFYDEEEGAWVERSRISYPILGGRDGGYRGYTLISSHEPGRWRCKVETGRGQVLGREYFTITREGEPAPLVTRVE